ncbi:MAG: hypothetical protein IT167_12205 [Bryobacterales bacterium]|nr:hypothetical protein [Bryobacterales bacterium]
MKEIFPEASSNESETPTPSPSSKKSPEKLPSQRQEVSGGACSKTNPAPSAIRPSPRASRRSARRPPAAGAHGVVGSVAEVERALDEVERWGCASQK